MVLRGAFDPDGVRTALEEGRVPSSRNEHFLAITAAVGSRTLLMGDLQPLPDVVPPGTTIELRAHYDVGAANATVTLFRGRVGDAAESVLCEQTVTGAGVLACVDDVDPDASTHYRAYSEAHRLGPGGLQQSDLPAPVRL